jgi:hypothetical protein
LGVERSLRGSSSLVRRLFFASLLAQSTECGEKTTIERVFGLIETDISEQSDQALQDLAEQHNQEEDDGDGLQ